MVREIIKLDRVSKFYRMGDSRVDALRELSLTIHENDYMAVFGPSGSGKSTLLHMMGLLDIPSSGRVLVDGKDVSQLPENALARIRGKKIGFIFQVFNLVPSLSALENVALPMMIYGVPKYEREKRAEELLVSLDMGNRVKHLPGELSGGQRQRVAIARSLANDPEVILADEPTGNLDSKTGEEVVDIFNRFHHDGKTLVVVTHDPDIARNTDEIVRIRDGTIVEHEISKEHSIRTNGGMELVGGIKSKVNEKLGVKKKVKKI
ncbi:MAG: ABC transporter ATP-binding protein [Candidatus ainarchaeum sp.]|nr:ABC transporter ATP-binding protein [Candidatus ainarchaeum sp.]MDD5096152.1 ABC transporter ATP-binding protein [Candidatus ainarchaeum sp.]